MATDPRTLTATLRNSHERLAGLVRPLTPEQLRVQSYDRDWTVAQVLSHLGSGAEIGLLTLDAALAEGGQLDRDAFPPIWDAWNGKSPDAQAADALAADERQVQPAGAVHRRGTGRPAAGVLRPPAGRGRAGPDAPR